MMLTSISTNSLVELQEWCRDYDRRNLHPCDFFVRFAIGFYQIYQGIEWKDKYNKNESLAAASVHFIIVAEKLNLNLEEHLNKNIANWDYNSDINWKQLFCKLSKAQQHLFYHFKTFKLNPNYQRKTRYNPKVLNKLLAESIGFLIGAIEPDHRDMAIEDATKIMSGRL
jgi:hypothetical protein